MVKMAYCQLPFYLILAYRQPWLTISPWLTLESNVNHG